jgi:hypothetical protein
MFTTPRSTTNTVTPTENLVTSEQHKQCSSVIIDTERLNLVSTTDDSIPPRLKDEQTEIENVLEFTYNEYDMICEEKSSPNDISMLEDKVDNLQHLSDLSVVSIIKFCSDYCRYVLSVSEPVKMQNYISGNVKTMFVRTKTAKQWRVLNVADFDNLSNNYMMLLLQDYCTPTSRTYFHTNLKAATTYPSANVVFDIDIENFDLFYQEFNEYVKRFKYAHTLLMDYAASKHVVPFTSIKCKDTMTLTHLFLSRLSKSFIHSIYGRTNKRLSRFKSIETLIGSAEKTARILHKQYCKSNEVNDMT